MMHHELTGHGSFNTGRLGFEARGAITGFALIECYGVLEYWVWHNEIYSLSDGNTQQAVAQTEIPLSDLQDAFL
jgi:hypothetical protein